MAQWQLQEAKQKLSRVVDLALQAQRPLTG